MLQQFRNYQKYIYLVVTLVIIISFTFFGTYSAMDRGMQREDKTVFTAIDGKGVTQREVEAMALFLSTDQEDKQLVSGAWGPNFLNDGVIKKDFLETGLAQILVREYASALKEDLQKRLSAEKKFRPYSHPQVPFLSAQAVWGYFAPEMNAALKELQEGEDATSEETFNSRVNLFIEQQGFPPSALRQMIRYQTRQYPWIANDPQFEQTDLFLFGYHFIEDWFGPRFVRLVSEFVMNAARIAEQKGYFVSDDEAIASLYHLSRISYDLNKNNPSTGVANNDEYFREQLRRMGISKKTAVNLWKDVLLFRRLFHDYGGAIFNDTLAVKEYLDEAQRFVSGDLYRLPQDLRIGNFRSLQEFEIYLSAVAEKSQEMMLPRSFRSVQAVESAVPELVKMRYLVDLSHVTEGLLKGRIGLKELWGWQLTEESWMVIEEKFPVLAVKEARSRDDRLEALKSLEDGIKKQVDDFSRDAIVQQHPEWVEQVLDSAETKRMAIVIDGTGKVRPLIGIDRGEELIQRLDRDGIVASYSGDSKNFYRLSVIDRMDVKEVMTFSEAKENGTLKDLVDSKLKLHYEKMKKKNGAAFKREDGSWKELTEVVELVSKDYFSPILSKLEDVYNKLQGDSALENPTPDLLATYRLHAYTVKAREAIQNKKNSDEWYHLEDEKPNNEQDRLVKSTILADQWKFIRSKERIERGDIPSFPINISQLFSLGLNEWTEPQVAINGDLSFFYLNERGVDDYTHLLAEKVQEIHELISADAQVALMEHFMQEIVAKHAISLDYLDRPAAEDEQADHQE